MKRKDDDLLRLAFGELPDDAAQAVESEADASERAEIEAFRALRQGLDALPSPPPDGLTTERLRAAILDRELKGRRASFPWGGLLFAPAALAALAAVVILPRLRSHGEPQFVGLRPAGSEVLKAPAALDFRSQVALNDARPDPIAILRAAPSAPARRVQVLVPGERLSDRYVRRHRRSTAREPIDPRIDDALALMAPQEEEPGMAPPAPASKSSTVAKKPEPETIAAPPSTVVEAKPGAAGKTETVVLVSSKRDLETGAPAATEKEATSVLVGG